MILSGAIGQYPNVLLSAVACYLHDALNTTQGLFVHFQVANIHSSHSYLIKKKNRIPVEKKNGPKPLSDLNKTESDVELFISGLKNTFK